MHPDSKLTNHGKQVNSGAQSQIPNVNQQQQQQGPAGNLGPKGVGAGNHGAKPNQISPGNSGLKSTCQSSSSVAGVLKGKAKRERSVSMDAGDQRDALTPVLEPDAKEGVMRSKRRCVLEKKQPYSGDEWCSGADTEEDEDKPPAVPHRELSMAGPIQPLSGPSPMGSINESTSSTLGRGMVPALHSELPRPHQQVVYVFTTGLANSAAEAVIHGHADSILVFHQQNVPRTKLDQCTAVKLPSLSEQLSSSSTPPTGTPKSQSGTPRPASVGGTVGGHLHPAGTPTSAGHPEDEPPQSRPGGASGSMSSAAPHPPGGGSVPSLAAGGSGSGGSDGPGLLPHASAGISPSPSPAALPGHLQGEPGQRGGQGNTDGLSKEQLEHRERSLQTLRDIERLLLRSGPGAGPGDPGGPNGNPSNINNNNSNTGGPNAGSNLESGDGANCNPGNCNSNNGGVLPSALPPLGPMKKYEEPLQSIISQTQSLGGPGLDDPPMGPHHGLPPLHNPAHPHHHLSSPSGLDMVSVLGPDGLTPEQMAWRKLQEEYYQEKRRQQEMNPHHYRMMPEMGMGGGPPFMMRGPPPPYHSKPGEPQWGPGPMMGGGMGGGGNGRLIDMHQEGPRGPRFLGQMQRGPPRGGGVGGYPGNPGVLPMEAMGHQRPPRPGMVWLDDVPPNIAGGGPFQGCYPPGGPGGPPQHLQGDPDRPLTREEMFRLLEKRQLQGLHRLELDRLAKQQQAGLGGPRLMDTPGGGGFPNSGMAGGPPPRGDPMDFPNSRAMMGSPIGGAGGGGPPMRDLVDSPLGPNFGMNVNMSMNPQMSGQQQQMMLVQKLRGGPGGGGPLGEMLSPEEISQIRAAQNGRGGGGGVGALGNKSMIPGGGGPLQFPNQGPFPGGQGGGGYLQEGGPDVFGSDQQGPPHMGGTPRLSHMPMNSGPRGADLGSRHPSDLSINVNPMGSPAMPPPHQLKSPSISQEASPLMPSPSAPSLKSPSQMPSAGPPPPSLPATTGAGPPSSSMKSPQVMGPSSLGLRSPAGSPGRVRSPAMPIASPGWTASPKTTMPSPVGPPSGKGGGNGGSSSNEIGPSLPPRSTNSTPISQPGSMNPSMPFTSSPDAPPSQNPLSLIMSQMSKYAMPSSTPLYHEAIKTIATSDDEMPPDRPLLSGVNMPAGNMGNHQTSQMLASQSAMGPHSGSQSPMGMVLQGQAQLSHDPSGPMLHSPNPMGIPGMNPAMMGGGGGPPDGMGPCNISPMLPQNQMGGFSRMQTPSHGPLHSPSPGMGQQYPQPPEDVLPHHQLHLLNKGLSHQRPPDSFHPMPMGDGPDLSDVIRPTPTGIPEFDLSRIIPSDKPSSTLQYFPKSEGLSQPQPNPQPPPTPQHLKQHPPPGPPHSTSNPSSNPHIANLQNMMAEQQLPPPHPSHSVMRSGLGMPPGGPRGMVPGGGMGPMCHPGHGMGRTGMMSQQQQQQQQHHLQQQQAMMANSLLQHPSHPHPGMMSPQQHQQNIMAQQNLMMMQAKQRSMSVPGDPYGQQGPLMSPQGPMMGPPHPQSGMMGPQALRQRGMSLDSPFGYGPGSMANMPF
ncbi:B-cell CLL/lymphoma 9-like protein isoform X2 [Megalops cyprinoides]|uniref:B-cell CLL/lymphoma 9-like protein isoform X2 n=1 Tax=Megalops cyprinoides TaxID=118141 RepID=UPI00186464D7|nr:B-cell CLL/lymphoma 9-like protein isoform X2 [Megalops cyprinoides]